MKSNYKKLWQYISEVNIRNKDLQVDLLLWISIKKIFIPSIANIIWTNMTTYKIVKKNQFAYWTVTSRNWDKISIALLEDNDLAIVSQAYKVFEVIDENELLPEYLMMWFRRPEFDRYARFMSHGSTREVFDWNEMCNVELPVPDITKQQEIVDEYNTIKNRISLNNNLIEKLEDTAQAIYKQWFVDFEFPNEEWKPYKSNGGEMEHCAELEKEMPKGWGISEIQKEFKITIWRTPPREELKWFSKNSKDDTKWISIKDIVNCDSYVFTTSECITEEAISKFNIPVILSNTTILTFKMTVWKLAITNEKMLSNEAIAHFNLKENSKFTSEYIYCFLKNYHFPSLGTTSSIVTSINSTMIKKFKIFLPDDSILEEFNKVVIPIFKTKKNYEKENINLNKINDLILSKMATIY